MWEKTVESTAGQEKAGWSYWRVQNYVWNYQAIISDI